MLSVLLLFSLFLIKFANGQDQINALCLAQRNCIDCIKAHYLCKWCYQEDYIGPRCGINITNCDPLKLRNNKRSSVLNKKNLKFSEDNLDNVIQIRPQEISLTLRKDDPINITFEYRPARNFPLELYYLMDLTISMKESLNTMTTLGEKISKKIKALTTNFKIGFGSYVDKTEMPFYPTDYRTKREKNPCLGANEQCQEGYLFKHRLNFTDNINNFIAKLKQSQISGNVDNLEGGLDALMQTIICKEQMDWSENARKLVVFATESQMHLAGDGKLAGAVVRNSEKLCLINSDGEYMQASYYDYPSLEEIHHQLNKRKINVIFATKEEALSYYNELHKIIPESTFVGLLEDNSTNILELIADGYYDFIQRVRFILNTGELTGFEVKFFADCGGNGQFNETNICWNVKEGRRIKIKVQIKSTEYQDIDEATFYIEERTLTEKIKINVEFAENLCKSCNIITAKGINCINGDEICGSCHCHSGWIGENCEKQCDTALDACRPIDENNITHISCYGRGDCICGQCTCYFPFSGKFCDSSCPYNKITRQICNGPSHGFCADGQCVCDEAFSGEICDCEVSQENCKIPGNDTLCSDKGTCKCNKCICDEGFEGQFCQKCSDCEGLCNNYLVQVQGFINNKTQKYLQKDIEITLNEVDELKIEEQEEQCYYRFDKSENTHCEVKYTYRTEKKHVQILIEQEKCYTQMQAGVTIFLIIFSILVAGIIPFLAWKVYVYRKDKIEYVKFQEALREGKMQQINPIYHSPVVTYTNPMRANQ